MEKTRRRDWRDRAWLAFWSLVLAAAMTAAIAPIVRADTGPQFLPPTPRPIVLWHCGPDVTTGRAVLVHRGGRHYDVVANKGVTGKIVARCVTVPAPVRVTP